MRRKKFLANLDNVFLYYEEDVDTIAMLKFALQHETLYADFKTPVYEIAYPSKKFLFAKTNRLYLTVISNDPDDDSSVLQLILKIFYGLICFRLQIDPSKKKRRMDISVSRRKMRPLLRSLVTLVHTHQATLFGGVESPPIDAIATRATIVEKIGRVVEGVPWVLHVLLLVGPEIVAIYSRPKMVWVLKPSDLLCLIVYNHSTPLRRKRRPSSEKDMPRGRSRPRKSPSSDDVVVKEEGEVEEAGESSSVEGDIEGTSKDPAAAAKDVSGEEEYETVPEHEESYDSVFMYTDALHRKSVRLYMRKFRYGDEKRDPFLCEFSLMFVTYDDPSNAYLAPLRKLYTRVRAEIEVFLFWLNIKANQHFTMKHFFHLCPGVIHFVFIDRLRGKVTAPRIVDLGDGMNEDFVRSKVWEMYGMIEKYKSLNYDRATIYTKQVIFSYRSGVVCGRKGSGGRGAASPGGPWASPDPRGSGFQKKVLMPMHPQFVNSATEHYELYAMYLPFVAASAIEKFNCRLIRRMCDGVEISDKYCDLLKSRS